MQLVPRALDLTFWVPQFVWLDLHVWQRFLQVFEETVVLYGEVNMIYLLWMNVSQNSMDRPDGRLEHQCTLTHAHCIWLVVKYMQALQPPDASWRTCCSHVADSLLCSFPTASSTTLPVSPIAPHAVNRTCNGKSPHQIIQSTSTCWEFGHARVEVISFKWLSWK